MLTTHDSHDDELEDHDRGLAFDLQTLSRRRSFRVLGGVGLAGLAGAAGLAACAPAGSSGGGAATTTTTSPEGLAVIPEETGGPFPADGTNGPDVLNQSGIVRRDIRSSFGSYTGTAAGVPLTVNLKILKVSAGGTPLVGAALYLWHCDQNGNYSLYSGGALNQNYLRGVQVADNDGNVSFTTIFPACYSGRWPHIHFEVYPTLANSAAGTGKLRTSQLALPKDTCDAVYATSGYSTSVTNLSHVSLATDMVFSDGVSLQTPTMTGSPSSGLTAALTVPV